MRRTVLLSLSFVCLLLLAGAIWRSFTPSAKSGTSVVYAAAPPATCQFPTRPAATPQQTVWQMFTAANCPWQQGNGAMQTIWESWPTQEDVFTSGALTAKRNSSTTRFHTSFQLRIFAPKTTATARTVTPRGLVGAPDTGCRPSNAPPHRVLCEEVRLNPAAARYVLANHLNTHVGQGTFMAQGKTFDLPPDAMEVKADWMPNCMNPRLHVESVDGKPYCLIAMHIISRVVPQWEWGTWEAKDDAATPNRCVSIGCQDSFGSKPAIIPSGPLARRARNTAVQTATLQTLERSANLAPEWANYSLDSAQDSFVTASGTPILSGNSITEEEIPGTPLKQCSCMTCHAYSAVNSQGADSVNSLGANVGNPIPLPSGYAARDFLWSFLTAPPAPAPTSPRLKR